MGATVIEGSREGGGGSRGSWAGELLAGGVLASPMATQERSGVASGAGSPAGDGSGVGTQLRSHVASQQFVW